MLKFIKELDEIVFSTYYYKIEKYRKICEEILENQLKENIQI